MDEIQFTRDLLVDNKAIVYSGVFKIEEIYRDVNQALNSRGYTQKEKRSEELVTESGKKVYVELRPYKYVTPEIKLLIKIRINLDRVTETKFKNENYQSGEVKIGFDAWYMTNYNQKWVLKPWIYFLKGVIGKYLYRWPEEKNSRELLISDTAAVYGNVKKQFKAYQSETAKPATEEEVMKEVETEIRGNQSKPKH